MTETVRSYYRGTPRMDGWYQGLSSRRHVRETADYNIHGPDRVQTDDVLYLSVVYPRRLIATVPRK